MLALPAGFRCRTIGLLAGGGCVAGPFSCPRRLLQLSLWAVCSTHPG
eukprot:COSAG02_NODE_37740_length_438_cov_0.752212_1_plen_46_part_10